MSTTLHGRAFHTPAETLLPIGGRSFDDVPARYGLDAGALRGRLDVTKNATLTAELVTASGGVARSLSTNSTDQYKRWIGIADLEFAQGLFAPMSGEPARTPGEYEPLLEAGDETALRELVHIHGLYLVGDSTRVRGYRELIERAFSPMPAQLFALDTIEIHAGATLQLTGHPVALLARNLHVHAGGSVTLYTMARVELASLVRS